MTLPPKDAIDFLQSLIETRGPSGFEANVQQAWLKRVKPVADAVHADAYGNTWAELSPKKQSGKVPTVVVTGHADEIGLMINHIEPSGLCRVYAVGGVDAAIMPGRRVIVHADGGDIPGVIGTVPIHLLETKGERKTPPMEKLFIDCGFKDDKEAKKHVRIGNIATVADNFMRVGQSRVVARATDNRIGIFTAAETLRRVAQRRANLKVRLIALSTVQEEIGLVGAQFVTRTIQPDVAIVVDVTHATDVPEVSHAKHGKVEMGKGPTVTHGTSNHPKLVKRLIEVAAKNKIPLQQEASSRFTGTDTDAIYKATTGIPSALISLPNRYMHTPAEMIDLEDLENLVKLTTEMVLDLKPTDKFCNVEV